MPKFSVNTDGLRMIKTQGATMSLLCLAQSYPPPYFRCVTLLLVIALFFSTLFVYFDGRTNIFNISISLAARGRPPLIFSGNIKLKSPTFQNLLEDQFQNFLEVPC